MSLDHCDVLIVGAGHAGAQSAIALRQNGYSGVIEIVGAEVDPPYERPALSKEYLSGEKAFERLQLRSPDFWADRDIRLTLGRKVARVDASSHEARLDDGSRRRYGVMIWAAGGVARRMTCGGADAFGVHTIRNRSDVDVLAQQLLSNPRVVIVGGGYIGLEAAAVLAKAGRPPVLLEGQNRVLSRVACEPLSRFYEDEHRRHGVDLRLATGVDCIETQAERVTGVRLLDGELIAAEVVIVGIGLSPSTDVLAEAGAEIADGVVVDAQCRTTLPDVFAVGDCANHANPFAAGRRIRLESVQNANDQATTAAKAICGSAAAYEALPWFWSNQYDLKLQTLGLSAGHDQIVVRGQPLDRSFSVVYLKGGRVLAIDSVNAVKDYVQAKAWILGDARPDLVELADAAIPLKAISPV